MESLNLIKNDPWLAPYEAAIEGWSLLLMQSQVVINMC